MSKRARIALFILGILVNVCKGTVVAGDVLILVKNESVTTNSTDSKDLGPLERVVDGNTGGFNCGCCIAIQRPAWIQLNLTKPYLVKRIVVLGRTDGAFTQFDDLRWSLGNNEESFEDKLFNNTNNTVKTAVFKEPVAVHLVRVSGWKGYAKDNYMTLCEIAVYRQNDCSADHYGAGCRDACHCKEGPCDSVTGRCDVAVCQDGWTGMSCNYTCDARYFGVNCSKQCSVHCQNNDVCNHITGECPNGCAKGYDFKNDKKCFAPCDSRHFGVSCSEQCSVHCQNNDVCNHITGECPNGCAKGYDFKNDKKCFALGFPVYRSHHLPARAPPPPEPDPAHTRARHRPGAPNPGHLGAALPHPPSCSPRQQWLDVFL